MEIIVTYNGAFRVKAVQDHDIAQPANFAGIPSRYNYLCKIKNYFLFFAYKYNLISTFPSWVENISAFTLSLLSAQDPDFQFLSPKIKYIHI